MSKKEISLPTIAPLWYQLPSWKAVCGGISRKIISYPRRHGKDIEDLCLTARSMMLRKGTYYYVFPNRQWGKRALWTETAEIGGRSERIIDHIFPKEIVSRKNENDLMVELINGSLFFMGGSDNLDFVGQGGQGYVLSEFSLHKAEVTSLLSPILRQSQASIHMNGTLRGKNNPLYEMLKANDGHPDWHVRWLKPEHTKLYCWVSEDESVNPEILPLIGKINPETGELYKNIQGVPYYNIQDDIDSGMCSYAFARQEYLNDVVSHVTGGYYSYEMEAIKSRGGIKSIDPFSDKVYTFWDLGGVKDDSDKTCILFAHVNMENKTVKVVDYYENSGYLRGHYINVVKSKGYDYGGHFFPHDGKKTNEWSGENSIVTARKEHGLDIRTIPKTNKIMNDIEIARRGFVRTEINSDLCGKLIDHLSNYHEAETTGKPCHRNNCSICHGASHGADTFRYMHMAVYMKLVEPYLKSGRKLDTKPLDLDFVV